MRENLHVLLEEWAAWRMCRPRIDRERDHVDARPEPGSRPPPGVWMDRPEDIRRWWAVDAAYESLPEVPRLVVRHLYLEQMKASLICRAMGIRAVSLAHYTNSAFSRMKREIEKAEEKYETEHPENRRKKIAA